MAKDKPSSDDKNIKKLKSRLSELEKENASLKERLEEALPFQGRLDRAGAGIAIFDEEGNFKYVNRCLIELLRSTRKKLLTSSFYDLIPSDSRDEIKELLDARKGRSGAGFEVPVKADKLKKGPRTMLVSVQPLYDGDGNFEGNIAVFIDITARKKDEEDLRSLKELHEMIFNNYPMGIFTLDSTGVLTTENPTNVTLFDGKKSAMGLNFLDVPEFLETGLSEHIKDALAGKTVKVSSFPYKSPFSDVTGFIAMRLVPLVDETGKVKTVVGMWDDTTEKSKVELQREIAANIIENTRDAVISSDFDGNVINWNPAAEEMYGYTKEEAYAQGTLQIPDDRIEELQHYREVLSKGETILNFETQRKHKDGSLIDVELTISPIRDDMGNIIAASGIHRDITERKQWEKELKKTNEELHRLNEDLKKLDQVKDKILAMVSHELRSPLVTVLGYIDLMLEGKLGEMTDEALHGLSISKRNLSRLTLIVEDIVVLSHLEAAFDEPSRDFFSLEDMVALSVADLKVRSEKDRLLVQTKIAKGMPLIHASEDLIGRVFTSLLSNAEKFSGTDVTITIKAELSGNEKVLVTITDSGVGIPAEMRAIVFDKFFQIDSSMARSHMGIGIGLALVKRILDTYNCEIRLEDNPGGGTHAVFELPLGKVDIPLVYE